MRLIALVVTLLVVTLLVGFFSYQQTDDLNLRGLARWISISLVVVFVLSAVFIAFVVRYKKPKADISLVRTGGKGEKVNVTAGLWINTIILGLGHCRPTHCSQLAGIFTAPRS